MNIPKWIRALMPKDLIKVLKKEISDPSTKGRRSAIDEDNVNDLVYYLNNKHYKKDPLYIPLKKTNSTPLQYSAENQKFKCSAYFLSEGYFGGNIEPLTPNAPMWYKMYYLYSCNLQNRAEDIYTIIYQSVPFECVKMIATRLENYLTKNGKRVPGYYKRKTPNKEKDIAFYQQLSDPDKITLLQYIQKRLLNFDIQDIVMSEGNYEQISSLLSVTSLIQYSVQNGKVEEFKQYIDNHRELFKDFANYQIIKPQFRGIYENAFTDQQVQWDFFQDHKDDNYYQFQDRINDIAHKGLIIELDFFVKHGLYLCDELVNGMMQYLNKNLNDYLLAKCKSQFQHGMKYFLFHKEKMFFKLVEMGYHPTIDHLVILYQKPLPSYARNFEIIDTLPPDVPLDKLKYSIAAYHPELIKDFIEKCGHRFEDNDMKRWGFAVCNTSWYHYEKACKALDFDPSEYIPKIVESAFKALHMKSDPSRNKKIIIGCVEKFNYKISEDQARFIFTLDDELFAEDLQYAGANLQRFEHLKEFCSLRMCRTVFS